jgi:hypothetical protein
MGLGIVAISMKYSRRGPASRTAEERPLPVSPSGRYSFSASTALTNRVRWVRAIRCHTSDSLTKTPSNASGNGKLRSRSVRIIPILSPSTPWR